MPAGSQGIPVQCAAGSSGEARPVEEDAATVDHAGFTLALVVLLDDAITTTLVVKLPILRFQLGGEAAYPLLVVVVGEVGAEGAAAVVGSIGVDAWATTAEDARPPRGEPGQVTPQDLVGVGRIGELDPRPGHVQRCLHDLEAYARVSAGDLDDHAQAPLNPRFAPLRWDP